MKTHIVKLAVGLATGLATTTVPSTANARILKAVGGPGGALYELRCPPGEAMIGLFAQSGAWIDQVAPVCGPVGGTVRKKPGTAGGQGGVPQEAYCKGNSAVRSLRLTYTRGGDLPMQYVNEINVICEDSTFCIDTGELCAGIVDIQHGLLSTRFTPRSMEFSCAEGEQMAGLVGRAGNYVDSLGIICEDRPASNTIHVMSLRPPAADDGKNDVTYMRLGKGTPSKPSAPTHGLGRAGATGSPSSMLAPGSMKIASLACKDGFVWRAASPDDKVCVSKEAQSRVKVENITAKAFVDPNSAYGPTGCKSGYVWREAFEGDETCVKPEARTLAREENRLADTRRQ